MKGCKNFMLIENNNIYIYGSAWNDVFLYAGRRFFTNSTDTADNSVLIGGIVGAAGVLSTITLVLTVSVVLVRRAKTKAPTTHPRQQQGEKPTQEEIHITNTHIPVENNQCYGTSLYSDQLYVTPSVEGEHNTSYYNTSPQLMAEDHDYDDIVWTFIVHHNNLYTSNEKI